MRFDLRELFLSTLGVYRFVHHLSDYLAYLSFVYLYVCRSVYQPVWLYIYLTV